MREIHGVCFVVLGPLQDQHHADMKTAQGSMKKTVFQVLIFFNDHDATAEWFLITLTEEWNRQDQHQVRHQEQNCQGRQRLRLYRQ